MGLLYLYLYLRVNVIKFLKFILRWSFYVCLYCAYSDNPYTVLILGIQSVPKAVEHSNPLSFRHVQTLCCIIPACSHTIRLTNILSFRTPHAVRWNETLVLPPFQQKNGSHHNILNVDILYAKVQFKKTPGNSNLHVLEFKPLPSITHIIQWYLG